MFFASLPLFGPMHRLAVWFGRTDFQRLPGRHGASEEAGAGEARPPFSGSQLTLEQVVPRSAEDSPQFKIQCIPLEPAGVLQGSVQAECDSQSAAGLKLVSTFTHDGHVFLVFKRP